MVRYRQARQRAALQCAAALLAVGALSTAAAAGPRIEAIRFWTAPDHTRVVADLTSGPDHRTRVLTGPDRIAVDIRGGRVGSVPKRITVGDGLVERVRLNQLRSGAQVVLDLTSASRYKVFMLEPFAGKPFRIVIDVLRDRAGGGVPSQEQPEDRSAPGTRIVVIDAGHGGEDPGTLGNGVLREKDVVLDIARELKAILDSRPGFETFLTRDGDYFVSLAKRRELAREHGGHLFVSIHANSAPTKRVSGSEVFFVSPRGATDQAAKELAHRENAADLVGGVPPGAGDDVLSILVDLRMSKTVRQSAELASSISAALRRSGRCRCAVKQAGFLVLKSLAVPSVLVEVGFLSSADDVSRLRKPRYRQQYAGWLAEGIEAYFNEHPDALADAGNGPSPGAEPEPAPPDDSDHRVATAEPGATSAGVGPSPMDRSDQRAGPAGPAEGAGSSESSHAHEAEHQTDPCSHTVAPGETLWSIARMYKVTVGDLRELNGLDYDAKVAVGERLAVRESDRDGT